MENNMSITEVISPNTLLKSITGACTRGDGRGGQILSSIGHTIFRKCNQKKKVMRFVANESNDPTLLYKQCSRHCRKVSYAGLRNLYTFYFTIFSFVFF